MNLADAQYSFKKLNKDIRSRYVDAEKFYRLREYYKCIESAQKCVELSLIEFLKLMDINIKKEHDKGKVLPNLKPLSDGALAKRNTMPRFKLISKTLSDWRSKTVYGDETSDLAASELFTEKEAKLAIYWTLEIWNFINSAFLKLWGEDWLKKH